MTVRCFQHQQGAEGCIGIVVRMFMADGVSITMCKDLLDFWLDLADDDPDFEPARLVWVYPDGRQGACSEHRWPVELCRGLHRPSGRWPGVVNPRLNPFVRHPNA